MNGTIKKQILDKVFAALAVIPGVDLVIDAASLEDAQIAKVIGGGGWAFEIVVGDDARDEEANTVNHDAWLFGVSIIEHLPDPLPAGRLPYDLALDMHGDVYVACTADVSWGGFAQDTLCGGGGSVAVDDLGARQGFSHFDIKYRHRTGDPTVQ